MQELDRVHTGASVYTSTSVAHWRNYVCYLGNFNIVIFQLDPFKHHATLTAPCDLTNKSGTKESSGLVSMSVSQTGQLAVVTRQGNLFIYTLQQPDTAVYSMSFDFDQKNNKGVTDRQSSGVQIQLLYFHPTRANILFAFEESEKNLYILNTLNNKVFTIPQKSLINSILIQNDNLFLGSALEGELVSISNMDALINRLEQALSAQQVDIQKLPVNKKGDKQLELDAPIDRDTIFTTAYLQWLNINFSTVYSLSSDPLSQISQQFISSWYGGYLTVYDNEANKPRMIGSRRIPIAKCSCFVHNNPGMIAVGLTTGLIVFVNISSVIKQAKKYIDNKGINERIINMMGQDDFFTSEEILEQVQVTHQGQVIVMKSASLLTTAGVLKTYIYGIASNGTFFVYDFNAKSIIYKTQANHTESIFQFLPHPSFSNMFASVSADATVKVWKDGIDSFQLDQQFGQSGYQRFYSQSSNNYIQKNIQHQGMIDTQSILGPLLSGAWDPRKDSCLMMVGSFKGNVAVVDIWRSQVHASYSPHSQRVCDIAWTTYPKCIACSVGADGIGRIYGFEQPLHLDSDTFKLSENYIEFCQNTCKLIGCSFSSHEPLLAIACEDGYVRVYDLRLFTQNKDQIRSYYLKNNLQHNHIAPIQIGKFAVSDSPLFKVVFHPKMKNVIGVTCDSGEVKVYRFEYDGASNFKVQCAATLQGHKANARPIVFSPEIPYICISGSWDGSVIVWNWISQETLYQFQLDSDVYGIGIHPQRPFELVISSRDLSIRKLFLKDLSAKCCVQTILKPICQVVSDLSESQNLTSDQVKKAFSTNNKKICNELKNGLAKVIQTPSYKAMKDQKSKYMLQLCGDYSSDALAQLDDQNVLQNVAKIAQIFYPQESGAQQVLQMLDFMQNYQFDTFGKLNPDDDLSMIEHRCSNGIALTARSLAQLANNLGCHYIRSMTRSNSECMKVGSEFTKQKIGFYQFSRKLPNSKADAYKYQFITGITLLAACGNYMGVKEALIWAGCQESIFYENLPCSVKYDEEGLSSRLKLSENIPQAIRRLIEAVGIYQLTQDSSCCREVVDLLKHQDMHSIAKLLAYQIRDEDLIRSVSFDHAIMLLQQKQPIKASLELISSHQIKQATTALALSGESLLSALCSIFSPEDSSSLGLFGAAELSYKNELEPSLLLKLARGAGAVGASLQFQPRYFGFEYAQKHFKFMTKYLEVFKEQKGEESEDLSLLFDLPPDRFFQKATTLIEPAKLLFHMERLGGSSLAQRYQAANTYLLDLINSYVKKRLQVSTKPDKALDLFALYNLLRHKTIQTNNTSYEGFFLSNYTGGLAAFNQRLYNTSAFMLSQAEKIQDKFGVCQFIKDVKLRKLLAVYGYSKQDSAKEKILKVDEKFNFEQFWANQEEPDEEENENQKIFAAVGPQILRSVFTPFDLKCQPGLLLCPVYMDLE
ncbi:WD40_repeat protein [Hexamita inflata]|uniref:WD40 repeat protein n=1 Tax=Hexamita inflata TaxID=28002 RepID=A0AA86UE17_9EUKA|nr:WD40 repeat protein [Hexamita inflata]